jgi:ABC-type bacteriocin/lantibiotic exporter with double-glycine peptidase domain
MGLLEPNSGQVLVDGEDISVDPRIWQSAVGYVPQNIFLTDESLQRNIAFGVNFEDIDMQAVDQAIDSAQLRAFVNSLPEGLNTVVGERGVRLSGGQRQRIGIARALYQNPPVLILDEATSSLDVETEAGVMEAVEQLHGEKTLIIVAHRLSTVQQCDRLFLIDNGKVAMEGSYEEVIAVYRPTDSES